MLKKIIGILTLRVRVERWEEGGPAGSFRLGDLQGVRSMGFNQVGFYHYQSFRLL